jgi:hypothetical protein
VLYSPPINAIFLYIIKICGQGLHIIKPLINYSFFYCLLMLPSLIDTNIIFSTLFSNTQEKLIRACVYMYICLVLWTLYSWIFWKGKFATPTPVLVNVSFQIFRWNLLKACLFVLSGANTWYSWSKELSFVPSLLSSAGGSTFGIIISHQRPLSSIYVISSLTISALRDLGL